MKNITYRNFCLISMILTNIFYVFSQAPLSGLVKQQAPQLLSGNGIARFDFFYAGEGKVLNMYIVRNGHIDWSYTHADSKGEISDAVILPNKNILFAHQFGVTEITPKKKVIWNYDAPEDCEIHTAQSIGKKHVIFVQNGTPAKIVVINKQTNNIVKELIIPAGNPQNVHGQFRNARLTQNGTILVAHMDMGKVCEYDAYGKELFSITAPGVWAVEPLRNGNILITCRKVVREINRKSEIVWELPLNEIQEYNINSPQKSIRLSNGNTIINNWFNEWAGEVDMNNQPVQAIEVTPDKKVVWILRSWQKPTNLGPSTTIIPLNELRANEHVFFGNVK